LKLKYNELQVRIAPSPEGKGWDEGDYKCIILFSSPNPLQQERA